VRAWAAFEREDKVWDILYQDGADCGTELYVTGTAFSKWKGPIIPLAASRPVAQQFHDVQMADDFAILAATNLDSEEIEVTQVANPDVYRVLSARATNTDELDGDSVLVIGTNWGGDRIAEWIELLEDHAKSGSKPFRTVTKVVLPAGPQGAQVSIGTTNRFGLYAPIHVPEDVRQLGVRDCDADDPTLDDRVYQLSPIPTASVDVTYATVRLSPSDFEDGDCLEIAYDAVH